VEQVPKYLPVTGFVPALLKRWGADTDAAKSLVNNVDAINAVGTITAKAVTHPQ
jgi:hypothetical protein